MLFFITQTNKYTGLVKYRCSPKAYGWSEDKTKAIKVKGIFDLDLDVQDFFLNDLRKISESLYENDINIIEFIPVSSPVARQELIDFQPV